MRDIHDIDKNGYDGFMKILKDKFNSNQKNLYYWLFNNETDIVNINEYKNLSNTDSVVDITNIIISNISNLFIFT